MRRASASARVRRLRDPLGRASGVAAGHAHSPPNFAPAGLQHERRHAGDAVPLHHARHLGGVDLEDRQPFGGHPLDVRPNLLARPAVRRGEPEQPHPAGRGRLAAGRGRGGGQQQGQPRPQQRGDAGEGVGARVGRGHAVGLLPDGAVVRGRRAGCRIGRPAGGSLADSTPAAGHRGGRGRRLRRASAVGGTPSEPRAEVRGHTRPACLATPGMCNRGASQTRGTRVATKSLRQFQTRVQARFAVEVVTFLFGLQHVPALAAVHLLEEVLGRLEDPHPVRRQFAGGVRPAAGAASSRSRRRGG